MSRIEAVVRMWQREAVRMSPAVSPDLLRQIFSDIGAPLSDDVIHLYELTGGMPDQMDQRLFRLWTPGELAIVNSGGTAEPAFADYCIECFHYRLHYETPTHSSVFGGYVDHKIAPSLEEFFGLILSDPDKLDR
jgi:hypothetical protein